MARRMVTVGNRGQVVIPAGIRLSLGIKTGTRISIGLEDARIVLDLVSEDLVEKTRGMLKDGGLVVSRAEGTRRVYQLNPVGVNALRGYLDRIWCEALAAFHKAAEAAGSDHIQEQ